MKRRRHYYPNDRVKINHPAFEYETYGIIKRWVWASSCGPVTNVYLVIINGVKHNVNTDYLTLVGTPKVLKLIL